MLSYWQASEGAGSAAIEVDLGEEVTFDVALFQENIRLGQRVEEFSLQAWNGSEWVPFAGGTTIGYKRLLRFPGTTARKVRLVISGSRAEPALSAFGLFSSSTPTSPRASKPRRHGELLTPAGAWRSSTAIISDLGL